MTCGTVDNCWFSIAWARAEDAAQQAAMAHAIRLQGHYGESRYAVAGEVVKPRGRNDYFPPRLPGLSSGERLFVAIMAGALIIHGFLYAWQIARIGPFTIAQSATIVAALGLFWTMRDRVRPLIYRATFDNFDDGRAYALRFFKDMSRERAVFIGIDSSRRVVFVRIDNGGAVSAVIDVRRLMQLALQSGAIAVFAYHNHPSGCCQPSRNDLETTKALSGCLHGVHINLMDHVILTERERYSFREHQLI